MDFFAVFFLINFSVLFLTPFATFSLSEICKPMQKFAAHEEAGTRSTQYFSLKIADEVFCC